MKLLVTHEALLKFHKSAKRKRNKYSSPDILKAPNRSLIFKYDDITDSFALVEAESIRDAKGGIIPTKDRVYRPLGARLFPTKIVFDDSANKRRKIMGWLIWAIHPLYTAKGELNHSCYTQNWWGNGQNTPSGRITTIHGKGKLILDYVSVGDVTRVSWELPPIKRTVNKQKWLEQRRARGQAEKSLKVLKKLGGIAPHSLPPDWKPDFERDVEGYVRLLDSLHPDSPGVSPTDMERFGQCLLYQAQMRSWYFRLPRTNAFFREPSQVDIDAAFDTLRASYRKRIYVGTGVYEYEVDKDLKQYSYVT